MAKVQYKLGRLKATEQIGRGSLEDTGNVQLVPSPSICQSRSCSINTGLVSVVDAHQHPLMPCKPSVARRLVEDGKATPFFKKGFFTIRLNKIVDKPNLIKIVMAIDPGSKRTGITVATEKAVVLNIQCNTPDWVKKKMEDRAAYRRGRRGRKTPCRKCRSNRAGAKWLPPSTGARWQAHLRILDILQKIIPITNLVIEDIIAPSRKHLKRWNKAFSPLEFGKVWFGQEIEKRQLHFDKYRGFDTKAQRDHRGFEKSSNKMAKKWEARCVDSHCLAELIIGDLKPVKQMYILNFTRFNRRELHQGYRKGGIRRNYGSTRSLGISRGTLVKHAKYGFAQVGGTSNNRLTLQSLDKTTTKADCGRLSRYVKPSDCKILTRQSWRMTA